MYSKRLDKCLFAVLFTLVIAGAAKSAHAAPYSITPASGALPNGSMNVPYSVALTEPGNYAGSLHWTFTTNLPNAVTISPNNTPTSTPTVLSFTPTVPGTYSITVTVTDDRTNPGPRTATNTYTITIGAECSFVGAATGGISFNNIDPSTTPGPITNNSITQQVLFQCNTTVAYSLSTNPANPSLISGSNSVPFTLSLAAPGLNVTNTTQISLLTTASSILNADYQNAPAGAYSSGGILVTISWTGSSTGSLTATVTATGTVINSCVVSQSPGTLTFNINPSITGMTNATISPDMQIKCTKNDNFSITAASVCGGLSQSYPPTCGGYIMPYMFGFTPGYATGQGFGVAIPMNISGSVSSADYQNAPVGNYGDLQTLTITY